LRYVLYEAFSFQLLAQSFSPELTHD
jgi:hypothetical protein